MKKKIIIITIIVIFLLFFSKRLIILSVGLWEYYHTDIICTGSFPTPPIGLGSDFPFPLIDVKPFTVMTDRGYMLPGDEYPVASEIWSGNVILIWPGNDGATFVVRFNANHEIYGKSEPYCKWFVSTENYK